MATPWKACDDIDKNTRRAVGRVQAFAKNVAKALLSNDRRPSPLPYVTVNGYYFTHDPTVRAGDVPGGEPAAETVMKTYYSCGGPGASWEAAATVSAAARELVELPGTIIT